MVGVGISVYSQLFFSHFAKAEPSRTKPSYLRPEGVARGVIRVFFRRRTLFSPLTKLPDQVLIIRLCFSKFQSPKLVKTKILSR